MRYLLDTYVVNEVSKKRPSGKVLDFLQANDAQCAVPSIVVAERFQGANLATLERRSALLQAVSDFCDEFNDRILPFDAKAARTWGEYVSRAALKNKPRSYPDTQIAAIALTHGLIVVTRNTEDFPEVNVVNPFED
ncbi:MAG TPA: PIN domain-containing protein [Verrucomicrobiae bacterium]|jgi:predicted nucleic acid-binding protein